MRKLFVTLLVMLSLVLGVFGLQQAYAEATQAPAYKVVIMDKANLLTDEEEKQLTKEMEELTAYGNIVFSTVKLQHRDYEGYSEETYYKLFGNEPGVIFQIDMGNRKITLSSSTAMDEVLRSERSTIVDNVYRYATKGNYYGCASECFRQIKAIYNEEEIAHDMKYINNAIFALTLGLILNFIVVFITMRKSVSKKKLLGALLTAPEIANPELVATEITKKYSPRKSRSGGGGGGSSGGGGGGFSGGSSSHGF